MRSRDATITRQGQVTIPADIRRHLGLTKPGKVTFVIEEHGVRLERPRYTLESAFGAIPGIPGTSPDFDKEIEEAMEEHVAEKMRRWREA